MVPEHITLGAFWVCTGLSLILLMRGQDNDTFAGIMVFLIALFQLLEYGVWNNLSCDPGGSNNKASRLSYGLIWFLPAFLSLAAYFFAKDVIGDFAGRNFLLGIGFAHVILALALMPIMWKDKTTWCTQPGDNWIPEWWYMRDRSPLRPNSMILVGILAPLLLVDPALLGTGSLAILTGSFLIGRSADLLMKGEWLSVTALLSNGIGLWALLVPSIRVLLFGAPPQLHIPVAQPISS
jgi:hypothetical protein